MSTAAAQKRFDDWQKHKAMVAKAMAAKSGGKGNAPAAKPLSAADRANLALDKNPLYDPGNILAGHNLANAAATTTNLALAPKYSALDTQAKTTTAQGSALSSRAGAYYQQLAAQEQGRLGNLQAIQDRAKGNLAQVNQEQTANVQSAAQQALAGQASDAAQRGGGLQGDQSRLADTIGAQGAQSASQSALAQQAQALGAQNTQNYQQSLAGSRALRGGEVQGQLATQMANSLSGIASQKSALQATAGDLYNENLQKMRQSSFENLAVENQLKIKQDDLTQQGRIAAQTSHDRLAAITAQNNRDAANRKSRETIAGLDRTSREGIASAGNQLRRDLAAAKGATGAKRTQGDKNIAANIGTLAGHVNDLLKRHGNTGSAIAYIRRSLSAPDATTGKSTPADLVEAAIEIGKQKFTGQPGTMNPNLWRKLTQTYGFNIPRSGY